MAKLTLQIDLTGRELALPNSSAGHRSLFTRLRRLQARTKCVRHIVCEARLAQADGNGFPIREERTPRVLWHAWR